MSEDKKKETKNNLPQAYQVEPTSVKDILNNIVNLTKQDRPTTEDEYICRFNWFFEYCAENGIKPTVEAFGLAMGWSSSDTISKYERGVGGAFLADFVRRGKFVIQTFMSMAAMNGDIPPSIWIFYGKNFFNMVDVKQVVVSGSDVGTFEQERIDEIVEQLPQPDEE